MSFETASVSPGGGGCELEGRRLVVPPAVIWGSSCSIAAGSAAPGSACYSAL